MPQRILRKCTQAACAGLLGVLLCTAKHAAGQAYPIFNGTTNTCTGAFLDSGGEGASGYGNNESYTYTICPDAAGGAISLSFITFNLSTAGAAPIDAMRIYDGNSVAAPLLGTWTGTGLQGQVVSASAGNTTGCLTVQFNSNNTGTGVFAATITCYQPCTRPTAVATYGPASPLKICPGSPVNFDGTGSYAAAGFSIASRTWDFGDGTVVNNAPATISHVYAQPGAYTAQLYLLDNNGCASTNRVDLLTLAGTAPTFTGTAGATGCSAETLCMNGVVHPTTWNETPDPDLGGGVFLPDNVGDCFSTTLTFSQFAPGQTLTDINQLNSICVSMEHSFMGDLIIQIISPTGQAVILHQQGGGGTYLGVPVDNEATPNIQGTCWNYCWSPLATNGTWADNGTGGTLPSGTYESVEPLSGLLGSQLNGTWTFQVCDMWGIDNGFICDWGLTFDPSLYPDLIQFTPVYGAACDSSYWTGPDISTQSGNCDQICTSGLAPGAHSFTYTVIDDFGCTYDTTVTVTIVPDLDVDAGPDLSTCGDPVQLSATTNNVPPAADCIYTLWLYDSVGDGWNINGYVTVTINGVATSWTLLTGSAGSATFTVPDGASIQLEYHRGTPWANEQSFSFLDPAGATLYTGANPPNGTVWTGTADCPGGGLVYNWSPTTGLSDPNIANPSATVSTTTQYCVTAYQQGHPDCAMTDCMTITVEDPVDAGTNGAITLCADAVAFDLFSQLGGTPAAGGTWTDPTGAAHSSTFDPGVDPAGTWSYTVTGSGACGNSTSSSTVTVSVNTPPNAGSDGAITLCSNGTPIDLFAQLGGMPDAGGAWSGPSAVSGGSFDPASMAAGTYTYTVSGTAPCADATASVVVSVNTPPNAGADGAITLCSNGTPINLFAQLGGIPDAGGAWSGPSAVSGGSFDPANMAAGTYTYTVSGDAPCTDATTSVVVSVNTPPNAGSDGAITLCSNAAPIDLFAQLGGTPDAGGAWSGPSAVSGGSFDPASMAAGTYMYTVSGAAPCADATASVVVSVNMPPNAGSDGAITLCSNGTPIDLFAQLGGMPDAGGAWSGPSAVSGGSFDPAGMAAGTYTYTVSGAPPCADATASVVVSVNMPPNAGSDGAITLCSNGTPIDLFAQLGGMPDAGGAWSGPSAVSGGSFDPAGMAAGTYTYTVSGAPPCADATASVVVSVNTPPNAGSDGAITLCSNGTPIDLFAQLGGTPDAGGAWSGPSAVSSGSFDPASMAAGTYTYTVSGAPPCADATASVVVSVNTPPNAGSDGAITLCSNGTPIDLFAQLGGTPDAGGAWSGPSAVSGGSFDPASMATGTYTYTVSGAAPCADATASVVVSVNTPPNAGSDGAITLCSNGTPIDLFAQLGGTPDAGGAWSGPSAVSNGQFDPAAMNAGVYTYTINVPPPCVDASSTVTINVVAPPDAGSDGSLTLCISSPAAALLTSLNGTPDAGGTWSGPSPVSGGLFDPATMIAGDYTYTVNGISPCPAASAMVSVSVVAAPNAGTPGSATLCSSDAPIDLFAQLGGTPDAGGAWSGPSAVSNGQFDPATMNAGVYTYTINVPPPCVNASSTVTINVVAPPDAGSNGSLTLCISSPAAALLTSLNGTPDAGGTWSGPSPVSGGLFDPATMIAGDYTYTVNGTAPCPDASAMVSVSVVAAPNAGTPGSATLCSSDAPIDLFAQLGGTPDAGGAWSGPSAVSNGQFDPATMNAGVYTYTINVPPPCVDASSTVTINVVAPPDAGSDGSLTLCISSPAASLFTSLNGTPDAGGTWSGPSPVSGGLFDPTMMIAGDYTYTVNGTAPCPAASAMVSVSVVAAPDAGTPGSATLCSSDAPIDLFAQLGGTPDAGGTWSGPSAVSNGQFDPATMNAGVYTYTINVPPPCVDASSTATINVVAPPDAGSDGSLTLCISSPAASLLTSLNGTPDAGGTWSGPSPVSGGLFDPATMFAGDYTYTVNGTAPCPAASAMVSVSVVAAPDAGTPGSATLCSSDAPIDLFAQLGGTPDAGGTWSGPSAVSNGQFDPATMNAGVYTYTINVPPPCVDASSTATINVVAPPDAGSDGSLTLCISSPAASLLTSLNGTPDAGGTWSGPSPVSGGLFDPATMFAGDYTYTVNGTSPCPAASAMVSVSVVAAPDAGTPGSATLCSSDAPIDLFAQLGGTPDAGGTWSGPSAVCNGQFDPAAMNAGVYTYTINVPPPCVDASSTVTINVVAPPDAGSDGSLTLCISSPAAALLTSLNGTPDAGGTWSGPSPVSGGLFDPATMIAGDYTYTVNGTSPCPAASTMVSVSVVAAPDAGNDDVLILCATGDPVDLFPELGGADPGGTWTGPDGAFSGPFIPGSSSAGDYTYTVAGIPSCPAALAVITVNVVSDAYAGQDGLITLCSSANSVELFNSLGASPQVGGEWLSPSGAGFGGTFTPGIDAVGTYLYVISVPLPCVNDTAMVDVSVVQAADAGTDSSITFCTSEGPISLMDLLGGTPDEAGYWSGPNGPTGIAFHPGYDPAGLYTYTVPGAMPCPDISSHVTIALNVPPNAGTDGSISLCPDAGTADLFASLGGNPNPGGTWATPGGLPHTGQYDPATDPQGSYTYTVTGLVPCPNDASQSTVTVYVVPAPDAGPDSVSCTLNGILNATGTWSTGQWSGPAGIIIAAPDSVTTEVSVHAGGAYTFTWSTISAEGCASADSVTIIFTDIITPSVDVDSALCHGSCDGNFTANISGGNVGGISDYVIQVSNGGGIMPINLGYCAGNYVLTVLDTNGCSASVPFTIPEPEPLVIDLVTATDALCPNSCDGSILVGDPEGMHFSIGNGAQQTSNLFSGLCPGAYTVTMWNANGCSASGSAVVESPPPVTANFSVHPDSVFVNDPTVTFTNASSANAASFLWHFGDGSTSMETSPVHSYPMGMAAEYAVCLTAFSINGCPDSLCVPLPVLDLPAIFVPNAFTPDGDGRNDLFQVLGTGLSPEGFHLMVFDRWGELIFDTTDLGASWDGTRNGTAVKSDVYVWTVKAYSRYSIEPYEMKGHVTLLR